MALKVWANFLLMATALKELLDLGSKNFQR